MILTTIIGIFLLILLFSLAFGFVKIPSVRTIRLMSKLPGPVSIPVIGSLSNGIFPKNSATIQIIRDNLDKYGGFFASWSWGVPNCVIANPDDIAVILKSDNTTKGNGYNLVRAVVGDGLVTSSGEKWRTRRKLLTPSYQYKVGEEGLNNVSKYLQSIAHQFDKHAGKSVEVAPLLRSSLLRISTEVATGAVLQDDDQDVYHYSMAIQKAFPETAKRIINPYLKNDFIYYHTTAGKNLQSNVNVLHRFVDRIAEQKRADLEARSLTQNDVEQKKKQVPALEKLLMLNTSKEDIRDEIVTFVFAGHDTVTTTLDNALFELAHHQDIQEKVYQEQLRIFGNDDRDVSADDLSQMTYLTAVIKETLRMFPAAPSISRALKEDVVLPGGRIVPATTNVLIPIFYLHKDPKLFPNPTTFDPERFLDGGNGNASSSHPFAYIPFSAGSRNCVGKKFAMDEMKAVLSVVLRRMKVFPETPWGEMEFLIGITRQSTKPVMIRLTARG